MTTKAWKKYIRNGLATFLEEELANQSRWLFCGRLDNIEGDKRISGIEQQRMRAAIVQITTELRQGEIK